MNIFSVLLGASRACMDFRDPTAVSRFNDSNPTGASIWSEFSCIVATPSLKCGLLSTRYMIHLGINHYDFCKIMGHNSNALRPALLVQTCRLTLGTDVHALLFKLRQCFALYRDRTENKTFLATKVAAVLNIPTGNPIQKKTLGDCGILGDDRTRALN